MSQETITLTIDDEGEQIDLALIETSRLGGGGGSGTVTSVSVTTANGVSASVANATTTPALTFTLGAITPTSVVASGNVTGSNLSGTNTGDQTTITGNAGTVTGLSVTSGKTLTASNTITLSGTDGSTLNIGTGGTLGSAAYTASTSYKTTQTFANDAARIAAVPAFAGQIGYQLDNLGLWRSNSTTAGDWSGHWVFGVVTADALILSSPLSDTYIASAATWNAKQSAITFGTGVQTALGVNVGSAGAPVLFNGAGGTPSSIVLTNATGFPTLNQNTSGTAAGLSATLAVASGGTGTTTGSITGTTALALAAGGTAQNVTISPSTSGSVVIGDASQTTIKLASSLSGSNDPYLQFNDANFELHPINTSAYTQRWSNTFSGNSSAIVVGWSSNSSSVTALDTGISRKTGTANWIMAGNGTANNATATVEAATFVANSGVVFGSTVVGSLPTASSNTYRELVVTDSLTPVIGATVAAGGSAKCKVMSNGSAWIVTATL
jgi:hypothetical protein